MTVGKSFGIEPLERPRRAQTVPFASGPARKENPGHSTLGFRSAR